MEWSARSAAAQPIRPPAQPRRDDDKAGFRFGSDSRVAGSRRPPTADISLCCGGRGQADHKESAAAITPSNSVTRVQIAPLTSSRLHIQRSEEHTSELQSR